MKSLLLFFVYKVLTFIFLAEGILFYNVFLANKTYSKRRTNPLEFGFYSKRRKKPPDNRFHCKKRKKFSHGPNVAAVTSAAPGQQPV